MENQEIIDRIKALEESNDEIIEKIEALEERIQDCEAGLKIIFTGVDKLQSRVGVKLVAPGEYFGAVVK